jgi:sigma-B regulation protein RsbU (phosphoserine phosphatase)
VRAKSRWLLVAVLVTSAIALLDAWTGGRAILLGLLIVGPLLAAASLDVQATAIIGLYALGLAVLLGIPDGIFATSDHLLRLLGVAAGAALALFIAHRRVERDQALVRITRIAEVAQRTILRPIPPRLGRVALAVRYLSASEDALVGGDFYDMAVTVTAFGCWSVTSRARAWRRCSWPRWCWPASGWPLPTRAWSSWPPSWTAASDRSLARRTSSPRYWPSSAGGASWNWSTAATHRRCGSARGRLSCWPPPSRPPTPTLQRFSLTPTDRVLLYTDGLVEARASDGRLFALDGQVEAVLAAASLGGALEGLVGRLLEHAGGRLDDDLALVLAQPRVLIRRTA